LRKVVRENVIKLYDLKIDGVNNWLARRKISRRSKPASSSPHPLA